ncbi:MAG: response regulator [Oscillospiraceae bacterium]|nr:response regulator [Oscillospiraceae bacterium]
MDYINDGRVSFESEALLKALDNTAIHYFSYDVQKGIVRIPQRTCEKFKCDPLYKNMPYSFAEHFVFEKDVPAFNKLYADICGGAESADALFRNKNEKNWCHVTITTSERDENGVPLQAVGIIEDLSSLKQTELRYSKWIEALGEMYLTRCYIDMAERTYTMIESRPDHTGRIPEQGNISEMIKHYADERVFEDDRREYLNRFGAEYIRSALNEKNRSISLEYRQRNNSGTLNWVRGTVILVDTFPDGTIYHVLYTVQLIDKEIQEKALLESSLNLMRDTYYRIGCIDLNKNSMRTITISAAERNDVQFFKDDFESQIRCFAEDYVLQEYREKFLNIMLPARMKTIFDMGSDYIDITYRRLEDGKPKWVRTELIPLQGYSPQNRLIMWYVKNISHEKAAEEKLSQTLMQVNTDINLRLETILGGISGGFKISLDDEKYTYSYVSESAAALFGYSIYEFLAAANNNAVDNIYAPDRAEAMETASSQLRQDGVYSVKYRVMCKDGSFKWIADSGKRVTDENGQKLIYSFYNDVTELEESNTELRDALTMLDQMVRALKCGIFAYRLPRREILLLNNEAKLLFGWNGEGTDININKIMREHILPEDVAVMSNAVKSIQKPGDEASYEFRIKHDDGRMCRVQVNSRMLEFDDGSRFILSAMLDITETSELTEIITEERSQYRDALLTNCEYAYSFDLTIGMITDEYVTKHGVNPFRKYNLKLPMPFDDFIRRWLDGAKPKFLDPEMVNELNRESLLKKFADGERSTETEYYSSASDSYTRVTALMSLSERNGHVIAVIFATDTTISRKSEANAKQALLDAYEAARRASSAKSDFLSRMSHDIRTPINAIIGMTAIAGTHLDDRERVTDCLGKITVSSGHLLSLINEVLDMSKIESGKVDLNEEEFNLSDLVDALISMVRPQIKAKDQNLKVSIRDVVHEKVIGDKLRIQQSFLNLASNAVKYTPAGGNISIYISEKTRKNDRVGRFEFIFEDDGIGMSPEFVKRIFEPFSRATDSRVSKIGGTGLGLAITDNLVRMMNGDIKVESELGKGSKFTVNISLKLQETEDISYDAFADLPVLVADDEESTCENACRILNEMGMKGEWVTDGKSAVGKVILRHNNNEDYFAVILDWKMPEMDGIQVTREIRRQIGPDVPIIIISAYDWSDIELEARAAGADAFISKPLFKSRLARVFHEMISGDDKSSSDNDIDNLKNADFSGKRVLLAEDNELNTEIAVELLEMTGLNVECAENGQIAVDKFAASEQGYYNLIFMDIQMPIMNGNEAARAIRSLHRRDAKGIPIVAMTANAFNDDIQASMNAGMNEHISKPLDLKVLTKTLTKWLNGQ